MLNINCSPIPSQEYLSFDYMFSRPFENGTGEFVAVRTEKYGSLALDCNFDMQIVNGQLVIKQTGISDWIFTGDQEMIQKLIEYYMPYSHLANKEL
ncbi:hypothetical protein [Photobacterium phosphoreum]|uniref:hypothetical protein n=1 Tax=Photobacterium phosphoreum TaxID=659 RepID=UPI001E5C1F97|nr:hypothetical protein [Photobacterium phosphoreum]MCD9480753.1 hypothetical protein [Photobacterium phosphoreum]